MNEAISSKESLRDTNETKKPFFKRYKWPILCIFGFLIVVAIVLIIVFVAVLPSQKKTPEPSNSNLLKPVQDGLFEKPDLSVIPKDLGSFDDTAQANSYSPKLSEPFPYGEKMIRGVNLGGWLVTEPFIAPSLFSKYVGSGVVDEWTLCSTLGKKGCTDLLKKHYDSWVSEADIKLIAESGLNHVRIPVGYWAIDIIDGEPLIYGAWYYLLRAIQWCRKYGIRVKIDFHGAPGSQNGWNHSGRLGEIRFLNTTNSDSQKHVERFTRIVVQVADFFNKPEWSNVVTQIGILNEPAIFLTKNQEGTLNFYKDLYSKIREINSRRNNYPLLVFHEGFLGLDKWTGTMPSSEFDRVVIDSHNYIIFDNDLIIKSPEEKSNFPCDSWAGMFQKSMKDFGYTMCGEFSLASNDCGLWLNGIGLGARYNGTYESDKPACPTCTCEGVDDYKKFSKDYKDFLLKFAEKQMDAFENGIGWYFWNFKTENGINPHWDYFLGLKEGWIPKDAGKRTSKCQISKS